MSLLIPSLIKRCILRAAGAIAPRSTVAIGTAVSSTAKHPRDPATDAATATAFTVEPSMSLGLGVDLNLIRRINVQTRKCRADTRAGRTERSPRVPDVQRRHGRPGSY